MSINPDPFAWNRRSFNVNLTKIICLVDTLLGFTFEKRHTGRLQSDAFPADNLIPGFCVADNIDSALRKPVCLDRQNVKGNLTFFLVNFRCRIHVSKA